MGLIVKKKSGKNGLLGIWELDGTEHDHQKCKVLTKEDERALATFHLPQKKQQWLAVRILLDALSEKKDLNIVYDTFNKPSIENSSTHISISHSNNKVAISLEPEHSTGIDIELIRPKVERIASKFMSEIELNSLSSQNRIEQLYVYWCAKEALYKFYGKKEVLFKEHLFIEPFEYKEKGELIGNILKNDTKTKLTLQYEKIDDYMLVYISYI